MATNLNCAKCTYEQAYDIMSHCIDLKMALLIHGAPGIGKSSLPSTFVRNKNRQLKKELSEAQYKKDKWSIMDIRLAQYPPEDMAGIPVPVEVEVNGKKQWVTLRSLPDYLPKKGNGILFLDEINQANPSVLAAVFQLILDRKMTTSYELPEGWSIVAACNDFKHNSDVTEFNAPINDRFIHIEMTPDTKCWLDWAEKKNINKKVLEYVKLNREQALCDEQNMTNNIVFASPRSWEKVSQFEDLYDNGDMSMALLNTVLTGLIGIDMTTSYIAFTKQFRDNNDSYDFDFEEYRKSLLSNYTKDEYNDDSVSADVNFARYIQVWEDTEVTESQESKGVYHLTRYYINHIDSNVEAIMAMWDTLFDVEEGQNNVDYIKENCKKTWELVYPTK